MPQVRNPRLLLAKRRCLSLDLVRRLICLTVGLAMLAVGVVLLTAVALAVAHDGAPVKVLVLSAGIIVTLGALALLKTAAVGA